MTSQTRSRMYAGVIIVLLCILPAVSAASVPDYSTRYTITLRDDGTALWNVEYRTPLLMDEDLSSFTDYSRNLNSIYLPELKDLMQRSAAQASLGTTRQMEVNNFTGNALVQTSPTGKFGLVTYTFTWTNFARTDGGLSAGDAFAGGMYLAKDNTLIIRYPAGYTITSVEPAPDQTNDGLIWYGLRAFGPGQPLISLTKPAFPFLPLIILPVVGIIAIAAYLLYRRKTRLTDTDDMDDPEDSSVIPLSDTDLFSLEDKIQNLLKAGGGEQYQSGIVKALGLPKSTVSSALNTLHKKGIIQKVKKGRENLIRLVPDQPR
ncbi:transcriptional regulator [uncultured Methanoregula sp.]|uniref:helix-turn-helix transcriptional regulator n=1 Tax=uncultured Methanoregula sp. TaxID=1005933 RepID=UPI002AAAB3A0|nr:transcriptional regulator [uncultured Methanoregula sp.]